MTDRSWQREAWDEYAKLEPFAFDQVDALAALSRSTATVMTERIVDPAPEITWRFYVWKFVHNALIHPLLSLPWEPRCVQRAHDWTAARCYGAG